jgi:hypothetical protein
MNHFFFFKAAICILIIKLGENHSQAILGPRFLPQTNEISIQGKGGTTRYMGGTASAA